MSSFLKKLIWIGSSEVQDELGYGLHQAQTGLFPDRAKPLKGFKGVTEIKSDFDKNTYRAVYAVKLGSEIYVLHAFQKKSKSRIKTPQEELDLIQRRFLKAQELARGKNE